mmetsp:Transcript_6716/g.11289  ORF Transcript_6716/g.11289 Transcript_6716/m.11289 type:complete len:196 (-) Transcript_6716:1717-2304(-)
MMFRSIIVAVVLSAVVAFTVPQNVVKSSALQAKSKALPFLESPPALDGSLIGDMGFDPLGFTENVSTLGYMRSAELKHGRVAMLATVGFLVQQVFTVVSDQHDPIKATFELGYGPNLQVLSFIGCIELATWDKTFTSDAASAGDFGFDPMNMSKGKTEAQMNTLKLKEIKNGRLAMIGIIGMLAQNIATNGSPTL